MLIKSLELDNYRNYKSLKIDFDKGVISFTETTPREKPIYLKLFTCLPPQSHIKVLRTGMS